MISSQFKWTEKRRRLVSYKKTFSTPVGNQVQCKNERNIKKMNVLNVVSCVLWFSAISWPNLQKRKKEKGKKNEEKRKKSKETEHKKRIYIRFQYSVLSVLWSFLMSFLWVCYLPSLSPLFNSNSTLQIIEEFAKFTKASEGTELNFTWYNFTRLLEIRILKHYHELSRGAKILGSC